MPTKFRKVERNLKARDIQWHKERGRGSHGAFIGLDASGNKQVYTIPHNNQKEISDLYLRGLARRFDLTIADLKE